jgi:hypothetical protein
MEKVSLLLLLWRRLESCCGRDLLVRQAADDDNHQVLLEDGCYYGSCCDSALDEVLYYETKGDRVCVCEREKRNVLLCFGIARNDSEIQDGKTESKIATGDAHRTRSTNAISPFRLTERTSFAASTTWVS